MQVENPGAKIKELRADMAEGNIPTTEGKVERFALGSVFAEAFYYRLPFPTNPNSHLFIADPENEFLTDDEATYHPREVSEARNINELRILLKSTLDVTASGMYDALSSEFFDAYNAQIAAAFERHKINIYSGDYRKLMRSVAHTGVFSAINGYHILNKKGIYDPVIIEQFLRNPTTKRTLNSFTHTHFDIFSEVEKTATAKTKGEHWDERFFDLDLDNLAIIESMNGDRTQSNLDLLTRMIEAKVKPETQAVYCAGLYSKVTTPDGKQSNAVNAIYDWSVDWIVKWENSKISG